MSVKRLPAPAFIFVTIIIDVIGLGIRIPVVPKLIQQITGERRGSFTTKHHLKCNAQGRIGALALAAGQAGDCSQALALLVGYLCPGQTLFADRAYEAGYVRTQIHQAGATAVIPRKKNRPPCSGL